MPKIFAFLFLPWRHKPLLLSHNHLHCCCQEEFTAREGRPVLQEKLFEARVGVHPYPQPCKAEPNARLPRDTHGTSPGASAWILACLGWGCEGQSCRNLPARTRASAAGGSSQQTSNTVRNQRQLSRSYQAKAMANLPHLSEFCRILAPLPLPVRHQQLPA